MSDKELSLRVSLPNCEVISITVPGSANLETLKGLIRECCPLLPIERHRISFFGRDLDENLPLDAQNLRNGASLHLLDTRSSSSSSSSSSSTSSTSSASSSTSSSSRATSADRVSHQREEDPSRSSAATGGLRPRVWPPPEAGSDRIAWVSGYLGRCRNVSDFEKHEQLGEGTYGVVSRAVDFESGHVVAIKRIRMEGEREGTPITSLREIDLLQECSHPNIVQLYDVVVGNKLDSVFLVMEYVDNDMARILSCRVRPFSEAEVKCLVEQLVEGVAYMHRNFIVHRDLKMSNLLYSNRGELKIADFGLARRISDPSFLSDLTPKVVTLWYRAPELLLGATQYSFSLDMWAVGCIFGELLLNRPMMSGHNEIDQLDLIFELLGTPNEEIWPGLSKLPGSRSCRSSKQSYSRLSHKFRTYSSRCRELLDHLLTYDPRKRITAVEVLRHRYFEERPHPTKRSMMPTFPPLHREEAEEGIDYQRPHSTSLSSENARSETGQSSLSSSRRSV
eukprot:CAMPEP_0174238582 /NCGR_PEP_ID=MMETSP0417-20130205/11840_1 /TAXON_ID=242541 /ORGANISM="Mayorella sp, Strain BSH-02190019" /LENGTH=506 /DNA_ID=CAMNT_0015317437 /DNA_START=185 /DNA_END=1702 /DNA_ORIENTATION=-